VALDLQIDDPDRVAGTPRGLRHQLEAQWLKAQEDVRVEQRTWVNEKQSHLDLPESRRLSGCLVMPLPWSFFCQLYIHHPPIRPTELLGSTTKAED